MPSYNFQGLRAFRGGMSDGMIGAARFDGGFKVNKRGEVIGDLYDSGFGKKVFEGRAEHDENGICFIEFLIPVGTGPIAIQVYNETGQVPMAYQGLWKEVGDEFDGEALSRRDGAQECVMRVNPSLNNLLLEIVLENCGEAKIAKTNLI